MSVSFDITVMDCIAFQRRFIRTNKQIRRMVIASAYVLPVILLTLTLIGQKDVFHGEGLRMFIWTSVLSLIWIIFMPRLVEKFTLKKAMKILTAPANASLTGFRTLDLSDENIILKSDFAEEIIKWPLIHKADSTTDYIFLYTSAVNAIIIPKKRMSGATAEQLSSYIETRLSNRQ